MTTRVLQVVHGLGMGGAETWLMSLCKEFNRTNEVEMDILITGGEPRVLDDEVKRLGARLHYISYNRSNVIQFTAAFRTLLRQRQFDAIHDHQDIQSGFHFLCGGSHTPTVRIAHFHNPIYQLHDLYATTYTRKASAWLGKYLVQRHATHILGTSNQLLLEYGFDAPSFPQENRGALHCGFETQEFFGDHEAARVSVREEFGWSNNTRLILFAGRLDYDPDPDAAWNHKNSGFAVDTLIRAMLQRDDLVALFVGATSPALPVLQARVAAAGLADRIFFGGIRHDVPRLMQASDTLFFPSRGEGLGMVAVEAQAAGLPVVASTAVPRECVVVSDLVRFVDLTQKADVWVDALSESVDSEPDRIGANALVRDSSFDIRKSASSLVQLYRNRTLMGHDRQSRDDHSNAEIA